MRLRPAITFRRSVTAASTVVLLTVAMPVPGTSAAAAPEPEKIHESVRAELAGAGPDELVEALVVLGAEPDLAGLRHRTDAVTAALERTAASTQAPVVEQVEQRGGTVHGEFWLQNMLLVEATASTLAELAGSAAVDRIIPNLEVELPEPADESAATLDAGDPTWGVEKIGADRVQQELGVTGAGVRVAVLDTGVDISHPDLAGKMPTDDPSDPTFPGGWIEFDAAGEPVESAPRDSAEHGTHVAGTVLGGDASGTQIGVAPDAELMGAMVIPGGSGTFAQVVAGLQWAMAPTDSRGDPAGAPADVVNMSLGGCGISQEMIEPTRNLRAAGILTAFAIGNDDPFTCPSCGPFDTASPGNTYGTIGVGATDLNDDVAHFSCGSELARDDWPDPPADWPESYVKPDVSAPGVDIDSARPGGGYRRMSGTSMATPHVAGTLALMRAARSDLGPDAALSTLAGTSYFDDRHGAQRPNPRFGWGRIDAHQAVLEASLRSGVTGVVTDAETGKPLAGALVTSVDTGRSMETDQDGRYELRAPAGTYQLEISQFGYEQATVRGVEVSQDAFTTVDQPLTPATRGTISGMVRFGPTGATVPGATVRVQDVPGDLSAPAGTAGNYRITGVPVGTYQVVATAPGGASSPPVEVTVAGPGTVRAALTLARSPATGQVSVSSGGRPGNNGSQFASISADGRHVAFFSFASNLVPDDTDGFYDAFVHDRQAGITQRITVAPDGSDANDHSGSPTLSADGTAAGFASSASNLVEGDTNGYPDTFVRDLTTQVTERVSTAWDGGETDGRSGPPVLSGDGRFVAFESDATNLVAHDGNGQSDVFVHDRETGTTALVSMAADGAQGDAASRAPSVSADGRYVAYHSDATNLVAGDDNQRTDVFVHDRQTGDTVRVSGPGVGDSRQPILSPDGTVVAYYNAPSPFALSQIYVHELATGQTELVSVAPDGEAPANYYAWAPSLSTDGNLIAFYSGASNLVADDTNGRDDVFIRDRRAGTTARVSLAPGGAEADDHSTLPELTPDGRHLVFQSRATNLLGEPTNGQVDVYVRDLAPDRPQPRFAIWDLTVRQPEVQPGQSATVLAQVKNYGDQYGPYEAVLRVDGVVVDRQTVRVRPNARQWIRFSVSRDTPGEYEVAIGPATGTLTVAPR